MCSHIVVIARVSLQGPAQVCLAQGDDMVDTLATDRSDQPFDEAVLPRRAWGNRLVTDAHGPYSLRGSGTVDTVPIADQVARSLTPRECLCDLACDPFRRRVWCDVDPDKVPANRGPAGLRAAHSTFAGVMTTLARGACNTARQDPCVYYWHAELGADGKDYRANSVHAPFPDILSSRVP